MLTLFITTFSIKVNWESENAIRKGQLWVGCIMLVRHVERYHLSLLLLHVHGATSFNNLKTVNGIIQASFKEACLALCLISDDNLYVRTLQETILYGSPYHCRRNLSYLLLFVLRLVIHWLSGNDCKKIFVVISFGVAFPKILLKMLHYYTSSLF